MRELYPAIGALTAEHLALGGGHDVYVETCGAADGIPALFLHGGPGSGCKADHRQFFDPTRYRVVLVDQRGAGRSRPFGGVEHNTTDDLVADLEAIRAHLGIEQWIVFGGSWGATLALIYAQTCPSRVLGLILRGSFLARRQDVEWFFANGANRLLPQAWQTFVAALDLDPCDDMVARLHGGIFSADQAMVERVARAWEAWSGAVVMFSIDQVSGAVAGALDTAIAKARIEMHYARHAYFLAENQLLEHIARVPAVPTRIIHGARDLTCPAEAAWLLHRALPKSSLEVLRSAGHLSSEGPMVDALVRATDDMATLIGAR